MSRKRFIKLLMSKGVERNVANKAAKMLRSVYPYEFAWIALGWRCGNG